MSSEAPSNVTQGGLLSITSGSNATSELPYLINEYSVDPKGGYVSGGNYTIVLIEEGTLFGRSNLYLSVTTIPITIK